MLHQDCSSEIVIFDDLLRGSTNSFDYYYNKFYQHIYANILKLVHDEVIAEDLLQDVFFAFWKGKGNIKSADSVPGWLFTTSYNKSMDFLKKKLLESSLFLANDEFLQSLMDEPVIDEVFYERQLKVLYEAVEHLPPRKQEVFKLCRYKGYKPDAVATLTGLTVSTVRGYLKESSQLVKAYIQKNYPNDIAWLFLLLVFLEGK